jgi:predicted deacylase
MRTFFKARAIATLVVVLILAIGAFISWQKKSMPEPQPPAVPATLSPRQQIIGQSIEGRAIESYTLGAGSTQLLLVGGIHGGYEWNSVLLAHRLLDYLEANPTTLPANLKVTIVPNANPDGLYAITGRVGRFASTDVKTDQPVGTGRFNAHDVDLNRNFDCKWQPEATWRGQAVSAGLAPFSEPEARALRDLVLATRPQAVVFWHSQANAVYASECEAGILPETRQVMETYAQAAGYPAVDAFDAYPVTGDAEGWLASIGIPAITVELATHESVEWEKNLAGVKALFTHYGAIDQ